MSIAPDPVEIANPRAAYSTLAPLAEKAPRRSVAAFKQEFGFAFSYALLGLALVGSAFTLGHYAGQPVRVVSHDVPVAAQIGSYADAVKVLGKPDTEVDGAQVNPQLAGATCGVWSAKKLVVCG